MSRFYEGDGENPISATWHGNIERICRGKRGQRILREFIDALLALPERRLIANKIQNAEGEVCAIGALGKHRGVDMSEYEDSQEGSVDLGKELGLGFMLAWQLGSENDMYCPPIRQYQKSVILDVPIVIHEGVQINCYYARPTQTTYAYTADGVLHGYSPEERWQHLYAWASSRIHWDLPVPA
jgi:hypothetical protein